MNLEVVRLVNSIYSSNTYCVIDTECKEVVLVDVGDVVPIVDLVVNSGCILKRVFLTHAHFDHIYGLNLLLEQYPDIVIYTSKYGKDSLYSDKLNFSRYHEKPFVFKGDNVVVLNESSGVAIGNIELKIMETPGHNPGCLCYKLTDYFFTGDSYIPGIKVITNLPGGDKLANVNSLDKIKHEFYSGLVVCPGHGEMLRLE